MTHALTGPLLKGCMAAYELGPPAPIRARLPSGSDLMYIFCQAHTQGQAQEELDRVSHQHERMCACLQKKTYPSMDPAPPCAPSHTSAQKCHQTCEETGGWVSGMQHMHGTRKVCKERKADFWQRWCMWAHTQTHASCVMASHAALA
eukprot:1161761-Pelagomonas_calceolata.AAC.15